jgi:hypothetical protein
MPPRHTANSTTNNWKAADDAKLLSFVKQGLIDPADRSLSAIKRLHQEWPHKTYKSFAHLVRSKLEKIHAAQSIEGARKVQARLNELGEFSC